MSTFINSYVQNIEASGEIYFVGDIQGQYEGLMSTLSQTPFNRKKGDVLIATGDLVDGGTGNDKVCALLQEDWFYSVMGNHDEMYIASTHQLSESDYYRIQDFIVDKNGYDQCIKYTQSKLPRTNMRALERHLSVVQIYWIASKGWWFFDVDNTLGYAERMQQRNAFVETKLPMGIEATQFGQVIGVVHASIPFKRWAKFKTWLSQEGDKRTTFLSRENYKYYKRHGLKDGMHIKDIEALVVGHNVVGDQPLLLDNTFHIDIGAKQTGLPCIMSFKDVINALS